MLPEEVLVQDKPAAVLRFRPGYGRDIHRKEILRVLERAAQDNHFIAQLTDRGHEALRSYNLSWQEKAALLSGDIRWIEARVGKLSPRLRTWLGCRLEQERW
jgi:hypothetical protein